MAIQPITHLIDLGFGVIRVVRHAHQNSYAYITVFHPADSNDGVFQPATSVTMNLSPEQRRALIEALKDG